MSTKQEQEQKKIRASQMMQAKQEFQKREQILLQKEFAIREWRAEIDLMKLPMEYPEVLEKYTEWKKSKEADQIPPTRELGEDALQEGSGVDEFLEQEEIKINLLHCGREIIRLL